MGKLEDLTQRWRKNAEEWTMERDHHGGRQQGGGIPQFSRYTWVVVFATVVLVALLGTLDDFKESKPDIEWKVWTFQVEKKFH